MEIDEEARWEIKLIEYFVPGLMINRTLDAPRRVYREIRAFALFMSLIIPEYRLFRGVDETPGNNSRWKTVKADNELRGYLRVLTGGMSNRFAADIVTWFL